MEEIGGIEKRAEENRQRKNLNLNLNFEKMLADDTRLIARRLATTESVVGRDGGVAYDSKVDADDSGRDGMLEPQRMAGLLGTAAAATATAAASPLAVQFVPRRDRVNCLRDFILEYYPLAYLRSGPVLDVAGGKGDLSWLLRNVDGIDAVVDPTVVDPTRVTDHTKLTRTAQWYADHPDAAREQALAAGAAAEGAVGGARGSGGVGSGCTDESGGGGSEGSTNVSTGGGGKPGQALARLAPMLQPPWQIPRHLQTYLDAELLSALAASNAEPNDVASPNTTSDNAEPKRADDVSPVSAGGVIDAADAVAALALQITPASVSASGSISASASASASVSLSTDWDAFWASASRRADEEIGSKGHHQPAGWKGTGDSGRVRDAATARALFSTAKLVVGFHPDQVRPCSG